MNRNLKQTALISCLLVFSLFCGCSPYKGLANSAYKQVNAYLYSLKKNGVSLKDSEAKDQVFGLWSQDVESLPEAFQKEYLQKAIQDWTITSIENEEGSIVVHVTLKSADLGFMDPSSLESQFLPVLTSRIQTLQAENPGISRAQLSEQLEIYFYKELSSILADAPVQDLELEFVCDPGDARIEEVRLADPAA